MSVYRFNVRKNWHQSSFFFRFNEEDIKSRKRPEIFSEAALAIDSPSGYMIDLGWLGGVGREKLIGVIVKDNDWDHPIEEVTLKTFKEAINWVNKWIKKIEEIEDSKDKQKQTKWK